MPNSVIRKNPFMTTIAYADCVVEAPYGGHPYAAHGFYKEDVEFIQDYVRCSEANRKGDAATWDGYLKRHIQPDHYAYLETVGIKKLLVICVVGFTLASMLCGIAQSIEEIFA